MAQETSGFPDGDDGLPCPEVRRWSETKYRLIGLYDLSDHRKTDQP
jgi:hypothetical protein